MSKWRDTGDWSYWVCAHEGCECEHTDPDTVSVTTCGKGHTNYLGPIEGQHRRAYPTARARAKDIREHRAIVQMLGDAIRAGRTQVIKSGRKPRL